MRFQINGKFVGDIKLSWWASAIWVIAKNQYMLYLNNVVQENGKPSDYNIHIVNSEGESVSQMMPFDENTGNLSPPTRKIFSFYKDQTI